MGKYVDYRYMENPIIVRIPCEYSSRVETLAEQSKFIKKNARSMNWGRKYDFSSIEVYFESVDDASVFRLKFGGDIVDTAYEKKQRQLAERLARKRAKARAEWKRNRSFWSRHTTARPRPRLSLTPMRFEDLDF